MATGVQYVHEPTNLLLYGAVDDIWVDKKGELIVVDYKATSKVEEVTLDAEWQNSYKRQMEIYQWLLRKLGFKVSKTGYFVYCNGKTDRDGFNGRVEFDITVLPYTGDDSWIEAVVLNLKKCLKSKKIPKESTDCEFCGYAKVRATM